MRRVAVLTVGRSDYGIYLPVITRIQADPALQLRLKIAGPCTDATFKVKTPMNHPTHYIEFECAHAAAADLDVEQIERLATAHAELRGRARRLFVLSVGGSARLTETGADRLRDHSPAGSPRELASTTHV